MKTIVYIDALNLYYRALKRTPHKWLNLQRLAELSLPKTCQIERINYYTARVSARQNASAPRDQQIYLGALKSLPLVHVTFGSMMVNRTIAPIDQPPSFKPPFTPPPGVQLDTVRIIKTEEKGSDVNLGAHLVRDAALGAMDVAAVITNDTDLLEPLRIAKEEFGRQVILLSPTGRPARSLIAAANSQRHIMPYLGPSQLPQTVTAPDGKTYTKPADW